MRIADMSPEQRREVIRRAAAQLQANAGAIPAVLDSACPVLPAESAPEQRRAAISRAAAGISEHTRYEATLACGDTCDYVSLPPVGSYRFCIHCDKRQRVTGYPVPAPVTFLGCNGWETEN